MSWQRGVIPLFLLVLGFGSACRDALETRAALPKLMEAPEFALTNLDGRVISKEDLLGRVWLVDFIFTRCGGPCPLLTRQMRSLQQALAEEEIPREEGAVKLVSITVDPEYDTPEVLSEYALLWEADTSSWLFLTGPPERTLATVREGFRVTAEREGSGSDHADIIHSTSFLLVDRQGWVRRIARPDEPDFIPSLTRDIRQLLSEPSP